MTYKKYKLKHNKATQKHCYSTGHSAYCKSCCHHRSTNPFSNCRIMCLLHPKCRSHQVMILRTSQQLGCRNMCKIITWWYYLDQNTCKQKSYKEFNYEHIHPGWNVCIYVDKVMGSHGPRFTMGTVLNEYFSRLSPEKTTAPKIWMSLRISLRRGYVFLFDVYWCKEKALKILLVTNSLNGM